MKILTQRKAIAHLFLGLLLSHFILASHSAASEYPSSNILENSIYPDIIKANGLLSTLSLSPTLIDKELQKLSGKKFKLSKNEQEKIKQQMLVRFHPNTLEELIISKLENTERATALLSFYQSEIALQINELRNIQLQAEHKAQLLEYQEKLSGQSALSHRKKLITVFDGLNYRSEWQAALLYHIQSSIQLTLPEQKRKLYNLSSEQSLNEQLLEFNSIVNMYSLRRLPSEQLINYLDALNANKQPLEAIDIAFRETLIEQTKIQFTLKK